MAELKKLNFNWPQILKIIGIILAAIVLLAVFINLIVKPMFSQLGNTGFNKVSSSFILSPTASKNAGVNYQYDASLSLSERNVAGSEMAKDGTGNYEAMQYNATVETGKLENDCAAVVALKGKDYVIFENSNIGKQSCTFSFKVEKDKTDEILGMIKGLKPRELSQNIESIKQEIEDFTSREEILKNKQASIEDTLKNAVSAYDEITSLATKTNNADSLAKVIDSKINILERLTQERLQVNSELEILGRAKARELDRLKYVNFYVYVYENKIFDGQSLKDSWIASAKQFVASLNQTLKDLSLGLIALLAEIIKYLVYLLIILVAAKLCWKYGKKIWKK